MKAPLQIFFFKPLNINCHHVNKYYVYKIFIISSQKNWCISNGFFKANFREKTLQKPIPTTSPSPFFRLELLQCFSTNREH